jgi:hypothetical protein
MKYLISFITILILISAYALTAAEPLPLPKASLNGQNQMLSSLFPSPAKLPRPEGVAVRVPLSPEAQQLLNQLAAESAQREAAYQQSEQTRILQQAEFNAMLERLYPQPQQPIIIVTPK